MTMLKLDPIILHSRLIYEASTGNLIWKPRDFDMFPSIKTARMWNNRYPGMVAGTMNSHGYIFVNVDYKIIQAHKIVWTMHHGESPQMPLDHINGKRNDNRIENLRLCTVAQNSQNSSRKNNPTGLKGATYHKETGRYTSQIMANGKKQHLGSFDTAEEAHKAYCQAADKYHGEFANYGY